MCRARPAHRTPPAPSTTRLPRTATHTNAVVRRDLAAHAAKLKALAEQYAARDRKVVSYWTMGFNQHSRGTWVNEQIYMIHLLAGKISTPGSGASSLTGQPSACGTAREVGVFAHRLPSDMVVTNPKQETLTITLHEVLSDVSSELGDDPGLQKDGVEAHLQELLAQQAQL